MKRIVAILCLISMLIAITGIGLADAAEENEIVIPEIDMKQFEIPDNDAMRFLRDMKTGWNLGNTFDAYDDQGWFKQPEPNMETAWHHSITTRELITAIKEAGFNTIRIPVSWHNHVDENYTINPVWIARVKEVAGWALDEGMYVIINVHHDNSLTFFYPDSEHYEQSAAYLTAVWSQIAETFGEYDEHLILESLNEPRLVGKENIEWWFNKASPECLDAAKCINKLNQLFVDTVRSTGGNNATRYLAVPAYCGSPESAMDSHFQLPKDSAENRIIVEVHAYRPYNFALNLYGGQYSTFELSETNKTSEIAKLMNDLYKTYISNGIPVMIDEFGALNKNGNTQDRVNLTSYYIHAASSRGIPCVWWDNCNFTGDGEQFGLIDRKTCEWTYPEIVEAIMKNCIWPE